MNKIGAKLVKAEIMGNTVRSFCLYAVSLLIFIRSPCLIHNIFSIFQAMIEKLKSQLEAAHKAKENHMVQMKLRETAKSKQVCNYLYCCVNVKLVLK